MKINIIERDDHWIAYVVLADNRCVEDIGATEQEAVEHLRETMIAAFSAAVEALDPTLILDGT